MRLLKRDSAGNITLTQDLSDSERPQFAILSHTWSVLGSLEEVTYDDMISGVGTAKPGYDKIRFCARQARQDGLDHFWIDTCCINKQSDAELSRSLISMFRWYEKAERCYVYLSDVLQTTRQPTMDSDKSWEDDFRVSRWFRRGWTLQELLAPSTVDFFAGNGQKLGTRSSLESEISEITCIPVEALRKRTMSDFTVQERLHWQEGRQTREPEDLVYSLFGVLGVSLPVLYGEGRAKARERLLNEIDASQKGPQCRDFSVPFSLTEVVETHSFVARRSELQEIRRNLSSNGSRQVVVLHGLGGIGKTQLALAYARRRKENYSAIFWLNAKDENAIKSSFVKIARQIYREHPSAIGSANSDPTSRNDLDEVVQAVKDWLSKPMNTRWLMIYDNYDNPQLQEVSDPAALDLLQYLPDAYHGSILITTRSSQVLLGHCIHIKTLDDLQDSLKILEDSSGRGNLSADFGARQLARRLDGLPLALTTAGAYLSQSSISFAKYLEFFERSWAKLQQTSPSLMTYTNGRLFSTWQISFDHVERTNSHAANLLRWWAYFDNQDLWFELLNHCTEEDAQWMRDLTQDELEFQSALLVLCNHGLVEPNPDNLYAIDSHGYSVHACVHSWMDAVLNAEVNESLAISALRCVTSHMTSNDFAIRPLVQRRLLNHATRSFSHIMKHNGKDDLYIEFHHLGNLYSDQGKMAEAEQMYQRALTGKEKAWGPDHTSTLDTVHCLGNLYFDQGKMAEAEQMYQRARQAYSRVSFRAQAWIDYLGKRLLAYQKKNAECVTTKV
ncbi:kinesin light chain 1 [Polychaeton citri CBS 116435]|uniref:Kinesin light chain 1 n=1 Tax=Polychaeton citri CBS 116435 TaxID=1314669 RepID=A0A9P4UP27_9PEZI|nr:kinesin light chain 1 [Polychaeton citri CBS 116435]